jgi:Zn-dependent alcohol dehydrogenase
MIQWYREGRFPIDKMMKFMPADDFKQACHDMHTGETIKPILTWS